LILNHSAAREDDMNQPDNRPVGLPGSGRRLGAPGPVGAPGVPARGQGTDQQGAETERLLAGVQADLTSVDDKSTQDQVPVFDRMHTALADALARTADTGGPPAGGHQGA
jgi:hypothetical protein